jgi:hypothetical protein
MLRGGELLTVVEERAPAESGRRKSPPDIPGGP